LNLIECRDFMMAPFCFDSLFYAMKYKIPFN
jgi:hypothetical protein